MSSGWWKIIRRYTTGLLRARSAVDTANKSSPYTESTGPRHEGNRLPLSLSLLPVTHCNFLRRRLVVTRRIYLFIVCLAYRRLRQAAVPGQTETVAWPTVTGSGQRSTNHWFIGVTAWRRFVWWWESESSWIRFATPISKTLVVMASHLCLQGHWACRCLTILVLRWITHHNLHYEHQYLAKSSCRLKKN